MPPTNSNKIYARSSEALKLAFCELLNKKSFEEIHVSEICAVAGYSRNAFYHNHDDKYHFAKRMIDDEIDFYVNLVLTVRKKQSPNYTPRPDDISYLFFDHVYKNKHIYEAMLRKNIFPDMINYFCQEAYIKVKDHLIYILPGKHVLFTEYLLYVTVHCYWNTIQYWSDNHYSFSPVFIADFFNIFTTKDITATIKGKCDLNI